ncbi:MAG: hypothetical protein ACR2LU_10340 [Luteitalea sp.]
MNSIWRAAAVVIVLAATALPLMAQPISPPPASPPPVRPRQVVSANPFGLVFDLFNVEYERRVGQSLGAGVGGSFFSDGDADYLNADVFARYYPGARPLAGVAFGVKAGMTNVADGSYFGVGFDINWSWTLGKGDHFYMGTGFGLKRLFGTGDADLIEVLPTLRILNVGIAF